MSKLTRLLLALGATLALTAGLLTAQAPAASAKVGYVYVANESTKSVRIACDFDGPLKTLSPGRNSKSLCTKDRHDVDQVLTSTTLCMTYYGPRVKDGMYRISPGTRRKIHDLGTVVFYNYGSKCSSSPWYTVTR